MVRSHCTAPGMGVGLGIMGYYVLCRTVHTAPRVGTGADQLSPTVLAPFTVPAHSRSRAV